MFIARVCPPSAAASVRLVSTLAAIFDSLPVQLFVDINFGTVMTAQTIRPSSGLANVKYEIRGKLARRAQEMERLGYDIISLNIGNPGAFGFRTPETMRLAIIENLRLAEGYVHQQGIFPAREA